MNIQLSQILLILVLTLFILYIFFLRTIIFDRLIYMGLAGVGIILVLVPDFTTRIANRLGIGRGVDLMFYLVILAAMFYAVNMRSQVKGLQKQITTIVREIAIANPKFGAGFSQDQAGDPHQQE